MCASLLNLGDGMLRSAKVGGDDLNPPKLFVSYSTKDREFVGRLLHDLTSGNIPIWIDTLEIKVGDSIIEAISKGIEQVEFFAIVLSPNSVNSTWVQRELNAALMKEMELKRVFILPIIHQDCEVPVFLKEKRFADFRTSYDNGLRDLLDVLFGTGRVDPRIPPIEDALEYDTWCDDLRRAITQYLSPDELGQLCRDMGLATPSTTSSQDEIVTTLITSATRKQQFVKLADAVLASIEAHKDREYEGEKHEDSNDKLNIDLRRLAELFREPDPFDGVIPARLSDGIVDLASPAEDFVTTTIVFRTTGERFRVRLPQDVRCETAARRIVGELFLEDLPPHRRALYLDGSDFYIRAGAELYGTQTLREASILDGAEITVQTEAKYPWAHDVHMASMALQHADERWKEDVAFRVRGYVRRVAGQRIEKRYLYLAGPP